MMSAHRFRILGIGTAFGLAIGLVLAGQAWFELPGPPAGMPISAAPSTRGPGSQAASPCLLNLVAQASPNLLLTGETTRLRITADPVCAGPEIAHHIVLVLDASGSMQGLPNRELEKAALNFIASLDLAAHPNIRVGVVSFGGTARRLCPLVAEPERLEECIRQLGASGGTAIDDGLREARKTLKQGREDLPGQRIRESLLLVTDGVNTDGCQPVVTAAELPKSEHVTIRGICLGAGCDLVCMRRVASSPGHVIEAADPQSLDSAFQRLTVALDTEGLKRLELTLYFDAMRFDLLRQSLRPASARYNNEGRVTLDMDAPLAPIQLEFELRSKQPGFQSALDSIRADFVDALGRRGSEDAARPWISVLGPRP